MDEFIKLLIMLPVMILLLIYLIALLFIMLISVIYTAGYVYDSVFGSSFITLGHFIGRKNPKIKNIPIVIKLWKKIQPKELYLRYETPLFSYCFSYTAISLLSIVMPDKNGIGIIVASVLYILLYFIGMARKCRRNEQYYNKVLENNMEFLKLSFLPLGFIITIVGFCFTITGMKVQDITFDFSIIEKIYTNIINYYDGTNILIEFLKLIIMGVIILVLFYIISLPVQVLSYFVISVIKYYRQHKTGYIGLFKKYWNIVKYFMKSI